MDMKLSNWDLSYNNLYMHKKQYISCEYLKDISVKWLRTSFGVRIAVYLQGNAVMQCNVERRIVMRRDYAVFPLWCECR